VKDQEVVNPKRVGSLEKDKPISLRMKTLKRVEKECLHFFLVTAGGEA